MNVTLSDTNGLAGPMTLTVSPATAPAGDVTFVVKNTGTIDHEAVVLKPTPPSTNSPSPTAATHPSPSPPAPTKSPKTTNIGETGDPNLKPGDTRTFTIKHMTAGNYAIVCNLAQHYGKGMRAPFTVTIDDRRHTDTPPPDRLVPRDPHRGRDRARRASPCSCTATNAVLTKWHGRTRSSLVGLATATFFVALLAMAWVLPALQRRKMI